MVKLRDVKKSQQAIENVLIIRDQMANLGCRLVCTFGNFFAAFLIAAHTCNKLDIDHKQSFENEGYDSESD